MTLVLSCLFPSTSIVMADETEGIEEWIESEEIFLDKVRYETRTRKLTVEITQTKEDIAHEYELYMLIEGELENSIGRFLSLGNILSILGIMTVDTNDRVRVYLTGTGKITITDQELYFGENEEVKAGTKVLIGVESYDENYVPSKSNLVELTIGEESAEAGAINAISGNDDNNTPNNNQTVSDNQTFNDSGISPLLIGGSVLLLGAAAAMMMLGKKNRKKTDVTSVKKQKGEKEAKKEEDEEDDLKPSLEDKTVFVCTEDEELIKTLKNRHYLEVVEPEEDSETEPDEAAAEAEAHLYICDINDEERLNEVLAKKKDDLEKIPLGLVINKSLLNVIKEKLEQLKNDKQIVGYVPFNADPKDIMIRLILPILKPDLKSDASLENIGMVCDLLGIPGVSSVISAFVSGRDIKSTVEDGDLGITGTATIISDVASILGMDTVASVSGLVNDLDAIVTATGSGTGAYEKKNGLLGAKDIVDVVKDLTDKD